MPTLNAIANGVTQMGEGQASLSASSSPTDRFAAIVWGLLVEQETIDAVDLQDALVIAGLADRRFATAQEAAGNKISEGDSCLILTDAALAIINAGRRDLAAEE